MTHRAACCLVGLVIAAGCGSGYEVDCFWGDQAFAPGSGMYYGGCGECVCTPDGTWACPSVECFPECVDAQGTAHVQGEGWVEGGEWCECGWDGSAYCVPQECNYLGTVLQPGEEITTACGTCTCGEDARLNCPSSSCDTQCSDDGPTSTVRQPGEQWTDTQGQLCRCTGLGVECCDPADDCFADACPTEGGEEVAAGATRFADGQRCTCSEVLELTCTTVCFYGNSYYEVGDSIPPLPGDNCECSCGPDGEPTCNRPGCLPTSCSYGSSFYSIGASWVDSQECRVCLCGEDGNAYCSEPLCSPGSCVYQGLAYSPGEQFPAADGCNECTCEETGHATCTEVLCATLACVWEDDYLVPYQTVDHPDGCNVCACMYDGTVQCTARACG